MTHYHSIVITDKELIMVSHANVERAEEYEYRIRSEGYESDTYGDINGDIHVALFYKRDKS